MKGGSQRGTLNPDVVGIQLQNVYMAYTSVMLYVSPYYSHDNLLLCTGNPYLPSFQLQYDKHDKCLAKDSLKSRVQCNNITQNT